MVYSEQLVLFAEDSAAFFCVMQSRVHEFWSRLFSSSMKDDLRYTPTDCFGTFPFPTGIKRLEELGEAYFAYRRDLMIANAEGLTKTYNRFHSPEEFDSGILELRRLHGEMDVAVLENYGWNDLATQAAQPDFCQFLLDYEEDEDDIASDLSGTRQKKKPWRYRWPDEFRDEVLARLLELNEKRHKEEVIAGVAIVGPRKSLDDKDEPSDDEETEPVKPTKPKLSRQSKKPKKPDNPNQPTFEF